MCVSSLDHGKFIYDKMNPYNYQQYSIIVNESDSYLRVAIPKELKDKIEYWI